MSTNKEFNINDYLDKPISDMPDMPQRELLPNGRHVLQIKDVEMKELAGKPAVIFQYRYVGCEELANPGDKQPAADAEFEEVFFPSTETGLGALKKHLQHVAPEGATLSTVLQGIVGESFGVTTTQRSWKNKTSGETQTGWSTKDGLKRLG